MKGKYDIHMVVIFPLHLISLLSIDERLFFKWRVLVVNLLHVYPVKKKEQEKLIKFLGQLITETSTAFTQLRKYTSSHKWIKKWWWNKKGSWSSSAFPIVTYFWRDIHFLHAVHQLAQRVYLPNSWFNYCYAVFEHLVARAYSSCKLAATTCQFNSLDFIQGCYHMY